MKKKIIESELFVFEIKENDLEIEPYKNVLKTIIKYFKSDSVNESKIRYVCYKEKDQYIKANMLNCQILNYIKK